MSLKDLWERTYSSIKVTLNTMLEEYDKLYSELDVKGKVVVDIGADFGSTARYFLSRGAARVISYEANPVLRQRYIDEFARFEPRVQIHGAWKGAMPAGDILKMDCEGCEYMLTEAQLQQFPQWAIGIHGTRLTPAKRQIAAMLERNGGRLAYDMGFEHLWVKT